MNKKYKEYLKSDKWSEIRKIILSRDNNKCVKCSSSKNLQVHHSTYDNIFNEENNLDDLVTLCGICHNKEHGLSVLPKGRNVIMVKNECLLNINREFAFCFKFFNKVSTMSVLNSIIHMAVSNSEFEFNISNLNLKYLSCRLNNAVFFNECIDEIITLFNSGHIVVLDSNGEKIQVFKHIIRNDRRVNICLNIDFYHMIISKDNYYEFNIDISRKFKSISSFRIFELISLNKNINGRIVKTQCYIAKLLDKEEVTTSQLNRDIKGAIKDINSRIPEIKLDVEYDRHSKEYTFKYLKWSYKMEGTNE